MSAKCVLCVLNTKYSMHLRKKQKQKKLTLSLLFCCHPPSGVFDECDTEVDVLHWSRHNVFLLYDMGIFTALLELLSMEIE